ncbi:hypothetical protein ACQPZJ_23590 [Actinoplanes sp. CA-054009]
MMIRATKDRLVSLYAGVDAADVPAVVDVFRRFAALPVEDAAPVSEDGDGVLAQFGTFGRRGRREFSADLTRQLIEAGGGDPVVWQLSCTLYWPPSAETGALASGQLWSFGTDLDRFFADVVALPGWAWALKTPAPPHDFVVALDVV